MIQKTEPSAPLERLTGSIPFRGLHNPPGLARGGADSERRRAHMPCAGKWKAAQRTCSSISQKAMTTAASSVITAPRLAISPGVKQPEA